MSSEFDMKDVQNFLSDMIAEAIKNDPEMAEYKDWIYRDLPRLTRELMVEFIELVGETNIRWITYADYGDTCRGQLLISPNGMERIKAFNEANK